MQASKDFCTALREIHEGLVPVWNRELERFHIFYHDRRTGLTRLIYTVENDDGAFRPLDMRTLVWIRENVAWEALEKYPNPKDWFAEYKRKSEDQKSKNATLRDEFRKWQIKENRASWKNAFENFKRGILSKPQIRERKIFSHS
jgi:hypothetical protein